jgi:hypothetical protein
MWRTRLHLAFLLFVFGELIGWQQHDSPVDWLLIAIAYIAFGFLFGDLLERWQVADIRTLFLTGGIFGILHGILISQTAVQGDNVAVDILFRPMGLAVLMFVLAIGAFRLINSGERISIPAFIIMAVVGLLWGIWVQWFPELEFDKNPGLLETLLPTLIGLAAVGVLPLAFEDAKMQPTDWRLSPYEAAGVGITLLLVLMVRIPAEVTMLNLSVAIVILLFLVFTLHFTTENRNRSLMDAVTPPNKPYIPGWMVLLIPFAAMAWIGFEQSAADEAPAIADLLFGGLTLFGALWLPVMLTWLGFITFQQLTRESY